MIGMVLAMLLIKDTSWSLSVSMPCALISGTTLDSWWKKDKYDL